MIIFKGWTAAVAPLLVVAPGVGHAVTEAEFRRQYICRSASTG